MWIIRGGDDALTTRNPMGDPLPWLRRSGYAHGKRGRSIHHFEDRAGLSRCTSGQASLTF